MSTFILAHPVYQTARPSASLGEWRLRSLGTLRARVYISARLSGAAAREFAARASSASLPAAAERRLQPVFGLAATPANGLVSGFRQIAHQVPLRWRMSNPRLRSFMHAT